MKHMQADPRSVSDQLTVPGEDHGSGEAAPAGHVLCQRAGEPLPVQREGEEGLPL